MIHLFICRLTRLNNTHGETQLLVYGFHPLSVAFGKVIVHCHHVNALTGQCIKVCGQCRHKRFTLAGAHFGNAPLVQGDAPDKLDVEMPHILGSLCGFANRREGFWQ